ncbi:unnamed protein product [Brachionus calyciflorus]|uniref:Uncharacterized protein n=1 Tax=Brachionus calyciflorus TaxID=104777 RepID=A0A814BJT3_9BILA|nr:unnamed protein product [Brachionus calyciflorus]
MFRKDLFDKTMETKYLNYSLADLYEDAAIIGSEFQKIISNYGSDVLKDLMPKVISVLELIETLTIKSEKEFEEIEELRNKINNFEMEKATRNNQRDDFEKELEEIDEKWKQETFKLINVINKLKDENKRLYESLDQTRNLENISTEQIVIKQEEFDYISQIKEENLKLKEVVRLKERELEQNNLHNQDLVKQIEGLNSSILNLRRKQIIAQNQIEKLVKTKAEVECALTEKEHQLNLIKDKLKIKDVSDIIEEKNVFEKDSTISIVESNEEKISKDLTNMLIYDANDPNRPRFTANELQKVLSEKNELSIRLDQTKEELEQLKNKDLNNLPKNVEEVQGPINREPDEKLHKSSKNSPSGIKRLLAKFR